MTNLKPRYESFQGSNCSGSDGAANRTYTLSYSNYQSIISFTKQGAPLVESSDYTISSGVITFSVAVFDSDVFELRYFTSTSIGSVTTTAYATTSDLNGFMHLDKYLPDSSIVGADRSLETIGTGDGSATRFFTDHSAIIAGTYTFYYGSSESAALGQGLTESTHYTLDKDKGILTLTAAGVTLVSTNNIYAAYEYNSLGITDSQLQAALNRAADEIDAETSNHWADGTDDTPNYTQVTNEKHPGKGAYDRDYFLRNFPLPDVSTTLSSSASVSDTTLNVASTDGFPSSGTLSIGTEKIAYSAKTSTTFTVTALSAAHDSGDSVFPYCFEISSTGAGSEPSWQVLQQSVDYDINLKSGRVHLYTDDIILSYADGSFPPRLTPNRFRASYIWGNDSIPNDIVRLNLMIAARDLLHMAVRKAHSGGLNDFEPTMINVDSEWIDKTLMRYRNMQTSNI